MNKPSKFRAAICVCLCAALLLPGLPLLPLAAAEEGCACGHSPVILLPGYSGPQLFLDYGKETEQQVWNIPIQGSNTRTLLEGLAAMLPKLIADSNGNREDLIRRAGEIYQSLTEKLAMNADGSSTYDITPLPQGAHDSRWDVMLENGQRLYNNQRAITESFIQPGPGHTTADHVYFFASDWRRGQLENAAQLDAFIQEVKKESGHEQVSLFGISYGGLLAATYFTYYGEKGDIDRAVLHSPALDGSALAVDLLGREDFAFDPASMVNFLMIYMNIESRLDQRIKGLDLKLLSEIAVQVLRRYLVPEFLHFGSFWDVIPTAQYAALRDAYLDPVENAEIIRQSDVIHFEVMPNVAATFQKMQQQGVKIANICGYGLPMGSGSAVNSDYIIGVSSTTGAAALALGESYTPAAFVGIARRCTDPAHHHLSPDCTVEAASAYLPEHTWFFNGQYHGQAAWDAYGNALYCKWLFTDEIADVYSNPDYPQFRDSCNPSDGLEARFSASVSGYLTEQDDTLLLKNTSAEYPISLHSVAVEGLDFDVTFFNQIRVEPGQTVRLRYETILPKESRVFTLTVQYTRESAFPEVETRSFRFTAVPTSQSVPAFLRYPAANTAALNTTPLRLRPTQLFVLLLALGASLGLAALAFALAHRNSGNPKFPSPRKKK
ncbi:MAG: alpha/beta hydrolase [Oscillospiraceae bacterium]|nr:alpha/beta hydrolase [Oscillospiraceae bacterium]